MVQNCLLNIPLQFHNDNLKIMDFRHMFLKWVFWLKLPNISKMDTSVYFQISGNYFAWFYQGTVI